MPTNNQALVFGKLRAGLQIFNPQVARPGTLGFLLSKGGDTFIIGAKHVLAGTRPGLGDPIRQPAGTSDIAIVRRVSATLDCAAAVLNPDQKFVLELLHIGVPGPALAPALGMRVIKVGSTTGVTEGVIDRINDNEVTVKPLRDAPLEYHLTEHGDSGSVWLERDSHSPVAMHFSAQSGGASVSFAIPWPVVLTELDLL